MGGSYYALAWGPGPWKPPVKSKAIAFCGPPGSLLTGGSLIGLGAIGWKGSTWLLLMSSYGYTGALFYFINFFCGGGGGGGRSSSSSSSMSSSSSSSSC